MQITPCLSNPDTRGPKSVLIIEVSFCHELEVFVMVRGVLIPEWPDLEVPLYDQRECWLVCMFISPSVSSPLC